MSQEPAASSTAADVLRAGDRVQLHSLKAKPEYNGKSGTLVAFDTKSERWQVDLASGSSLTVKAGNLTKLPTGAAGGCADDVLHAGDRVEVHSLQAKPEHNGKPGTLVAFDATSGRWQVDLASGGSLKVKAGNLTKLESRVSPPRASGGGAAGEGAWAKSRGRQRA